MPYSTVNNMIKRSAVTKINNGDSDTTLFPGCQIEYHDTPADTELLWPYGMGANPPIGSYCVTYNIAGHEENRVSIATAPDKRDKKLKEGECYFRNLLTGTGVINKSNGDQELTVNNDHIEIINGNKKVTISKDLDITVSGDININVTGDANINASGAINANSNSVSLGTGGAGIARQGDTVQVTITSGSSAGTWNGTITGGSSQNTSA